MRFLWVFFLCSLAAQYSYAQSGNCTPNVPFFISDLSAAPDMTWESQPPTVRDGACCGSKWPDRCIEFELHLHEDAVGINFQILSGAIPSGSMFYQIDCGPEIPVGEPICLDGQGPHYITFCKPGSNLNTYGITSIPGPTPAPDDTASNGCDAKIWANGMDPATVVWEDITGGGIYESYLSCKNACDTAYVSLQPGAPAFVDYRVCGEPLSICVTDPIICDTVRVHFVPPLVATIQPDPANYCANETGILLDGTVSGGDGNLNYHWTDGPNGNGNVVAVDTTDFYATGAGTYSLVVTDGTFPGCPPVITEVEVAVDPVPGLDIGDDPFVCSDNPTVQLNAVITGVTTGVWAGGTGTFNPDRNDPNATYTPSLTEQNAGSVELTFTTTNTGACEAASDRILITIADPPIVNIDAPPLCGNPTTIITAEVSGGIKPYSYSWNTGETSSIIVKPAGTYTVAVSDGAAPNGCVTVTSVTIEDYLPLDFSLIPSEAVVACDSFATVTAVVSGGDGNYTYLWNTGETTSSITSVPGKYTITVTDGQGCQETDQLEVRGANTTLSAQISQPAPLCFGTTTDIVVNGLGGFGGYTYTWNTGETTTSINVGPGSYCAAIEDSEGCVTRACVIVTEAPLLTASIQGDNTVCSGETTTLIAAASGGSPPYIYKWNTAQIGTQITVGPGTYEVTITDNNPNKCEVVIPFTVTEAPPITITESVQDARCKGSSDGSISVVVDGGTLPYSYSWSPVGGSNSTASGLPAGTYTLIVTDGEGCTQSGTYVVNEPAAPLSSNLTKLSDVSCNGGNNGGAQVSASGGTSPYTFQWQPSNNITATVNTLSKGTYTVTVTDNNGCKTQGSITINEPPAISLLPGAVTNTSCFGKLDGRASVSVTGGTPNYTYQWAPSGASGPIATGLAAGSHTITITDLNGCKRSTEINISEPPELTAVINGSDIRCNGDNSGSIVAATTGGISPLSFSWSPSGQTGPTASGLSSGTHFLTVTDNNGCTVSESTTLTQPPPLTIQSFATSFIKCDSTAKLYANVSGGTGDLNVTWSDGTVGDTAVAGLGLHTVTVTDSLQCISRDTVGVYPDNSDLRATINAPDYTCIGESQILNLAVTGAVGSVDIEWDLGETSSSVTRGTGLHCVTVTDVDGCEFTDCKLIEQDSIFVTIESDSVVCMDDSTTLIATGESNSGQHTYSWNTGEADSSVVKGAGTYLVTATNDIQCEATTSAKIRNAQELVVEVTAVDVSCKGDDNGAAYAEVSSGERPFTYNWQPQSKSDSSIFNLAAGSYSLTVEDRYGCSVTVNYEITEPAVALQIDSTAVIHVNCFGESTGGGSVYVSGGEPPYNYLWSPGIDTLSSVDDLPAGTYNIVVGDSRGCSVSTTITVNEPSAPLSIELENQIDVSCFGIANGSLITTTSGGTPAYSYEWDPISGSGASLTGIPIGTYNVTVTDSKGCTDTLADLEITEPDQLTIDMEAGNASCSNSTDGTGEVNVTGGEGPYEYSWRPGNQTTAFVPGLGAGSHSIKITDVNGCTLSDTLTVGVENDPKADFTADNVCLGGTNEFINKSSSGIYAWDFGDGANSAIANPLHTYSTVGKYNVCLVVTQGSCFDFNCKEVTIGLPPENCLTDTIIGCAPFEVSFANCDATADSCFWDFGDGTSSMDCAPVHEYDSAGCYDVTVSVKSQEGCVATFAKPCYVDIKPSPVADFDVSPEESTIFDPEFSFFDQSSDAERWHWDFIDNGDTSVLQNPVHAYQSPGIHCPELTVWNQYNCPDTAVNCVEVIPDWSFFVPNVFTPNNVGENETFIGEGIGILTHKMWIYDRWGVLMHSTNSEEDGYAVPWNGRIKNNGNLVQEDTYVYVVKVVNIFNEEHKFVGHVTVLR